MIPILNLIQSNSWFSLLKLYLKKGITNNEIEREIRISFSNKTIGSFANSKGIALETE